MSREPEASAATERALDFLLALARVWITGSRGGRGQAPPLRSHDDAEGVGQWPANPAVEEEVERIARIHGLLPWLHSMGETIPESLPADRHRRLAWEGERFETFAFQSALYDLLATVVEGCRAAGCPVAILKGPAAAARVWGDVGLRPTSDLDLLCRRSDLPAVARAVRAAGLAPDAHSATYHLTFRGERPGFVLELHFGLYDFVDRPAFLEALWDSVVEIDLDGRSVPALSPEAAHAVGIAHWVHHDGRLRLPQLMETAAPVWRGELDTQEVADLLQKAGLGAVGALGVALLERLFSLPPAPDSLGPGASGGDETDLVRQTRRWIAEREERKELPSPLSETRSRRGWHLVAHAVRLAFPPQAELQALYGCSWLGALARRPAHLAGAARRLLGKLRARRQAAMAPASRHAAGPSLKERVYRGR